MKKILTSSLFILAISAVASAQTEQKGEENATKTTTIKPLAEPVKRPAAKRIEPAGPKVTKKEVEVRERELRPAPKSVIQVEPIKKQEIKKEQN